ncbi:ribosome recycling factor [Candidatus Sneabacter namystus]|uniref:Ribosome-recycling factor n=1 Tax=Candidatus Sneabacter namystus TaxID=2601646 RepID=A0A5C0UIT4_9RICK|nr:ribosome recycling factor [Candidatus Sneabacter namystus]QEK39697.1 ribosome recycling factor [Candidatus Sneabacter namystus]
MEVEEIIDDAKSRMHKAIDVLLDNLKGLRTGRAVPSLLTSIKVKAYDNESPLSQLANVSILDSKTLKVQPWDTSLVKTVQKAITDSNLGVNPVISEQSILVSIPSLSEDRRKEIVKIAHKYGENCKISIRNIRRDALEHIKKLEKEHALSEDEKKRFSEMLQKHTNECTSKVSEYEARKEQEIMTI